MSLTRWDRLRIRWLPAWYWRWYERRLSRWAKRHGVPPRPPLEELLPDLFSRPDKETTDEG